MREAVILLALGLLITQVVLLFLKVTQVIIWPMTYVLLPALGILALGVWSIVRYVIKSEEG